MFTERTVTCVHPGGTHPIVYSVFNPGAARTIICVHGLSRNGRDFDWLAEKLAVDGYRVICPDMAGRGRSPDLPDPAFYNYPQYLSDIVAVLARENAAEIDWIGTSMGGLLGMMMAAQGGSVRRLVLNDIGPFISGAALERIRANVGNNPVYASQQDFGKAFVARMMNFGLRDDAEHAFMASISMRQMPGGAYTQNYDVGIVGGMGSGPLADVDLWPIWAAMAQPVLVLHGANSDVLSAVTIEKMRVGKRLTSVSFNNVGHAPALLGEDQIGVIRDWLKTVY